MPLLEETEAKSWLKLANPSPDQELVLPLLIDGISEAINTYCGRTFVSATLTEKYDGTNFRLLTLKNYPVISVTTVTRTKEDASDTAVVVASAEYKVQKTTGMLLMHPVNFVDSSVWLKGDENYNIVYVSGYATVPKDIVVACKIWLSVLWESADQKLFAVASSTIGDETISFESEEIPPQVKLLLKEYRKIR